MNHSTCYERTFRAEVLKELFASVSGAAYRLETDDGDDLGHEAWIYADCLLLPGNDSDEALDNADQKLKEMQTKLSELKERV